MNKQKIVYIDMDGVIADFDKARENHPLSKTTPYKGRPDTIPGIYENLEPIEGAIESVNSLLETPVYDVYFLSTAPWDNPEAWMHKRLWIDKHFETKRIRKRLILSHQKHLMIGDYLIDDRRFNGASEFIGKWIHFGSQKFPDWISIMDYLIIKNQ
jgi:5'(3')-deoxyribonucleotidase